ncbi:MAG: TetR/AcrR family transcriptional regulator [Pseudomonadota bacterium]
MIHGQADNSKPVKAIKPAKAAKPAAVRGRPPVRRAAIGATHTGAADAHVPEDIRDAVSRLKRDRIVAAAVELFYAQGYGRTTLEQVADALHVTKPFIYAHFSSKNELLAEIGSRAIRLAHEALNRALAQDGSQAEKLQLVVREFLLAVLRHQAHAMIYSREETELLPKDRDAINQLRSEFDRRLNMVLEAGVKNGEFVVEDPPLAALAIGGIIGWAPVWYRAGGRLSMEETAERLSRLALTMVGARPTHKTTNRP